MFYHCIWWSLQQVYTPWKLFCKNWWTIAWIQEYKTLPQWHYKSITRLVYRRQICGNNKWNKMSFHTESIQTPCKIRVCIFYIRSFNFYYWIILVLLNWIQILYCYACRVHVIDISFGFLASHRLSIKNLNIMLFKNCQWQVILSLFAEF